MKILFVVRDINYFERFGIMTLGALLKKNQHQVEYCFTLQDDIDAVMRSLSPDIVAYTLTTSFHTYYLELNRKLKEKYSFFAIAGGPHPTFYPAELETEGLDAICRGEGEGAMLDLVRALEKGDDITGIKNLNVKIGGKIYTNPLRPLISDLDTLPFPDRAPIYQKNKWFYRLKIKGFMAGRGCPYQCSYCFNREFNNLHKGLGKIVRKRSPQNLIDEIKEVRAAYPLGIVRFMDDTFCLGEAGWLEEFARLYVAEIGLPYVCMGRYELMDDRTVSLLKESGCISIYNAIEAGNERIRRDIACRRQTEEQIMTGARRVHQAGIKICAENIIGFPTETIENMFETVKLNIDARVECAIASILNPYPGTKVAQIAHDHDLLPKEAHNIIPTSFFAGTPFNYPQKKKNQIMRLRALFNIMVAFPFLYRFRNLLINLPLLRLYSICSELTHIYLMRRKIFPISMGLVSVIGNLLLFVKRNRE